MIKKIHDSISDEVETDLYHLQGILRTLKQALLYAEYPENEPLALTATVAGKILREVRTKIFDLPEGRL